MSCTNCALSVHKYLENEGAQNVQVNFMAGDVSFEKDTHLSEATLQKGIDSLGYNIKNDKSNTSSKRFGFKNHLQRFWFCFIFTCP